MTDFSQCIECRKRLHNAFFCPDCGAAACSWRCFSQHRSRHLNRSPAEVATIRSEMGDLFNEPEA